jgi:peptidoglycan/xylan/chitin deacetylase (PgdA/CDA1 family)
MKRRLAALTSTWKTTGGRSYEITWESRSHSSEVERQLDALLELLDCCDARATVFAVGRLASELLGRCWSAILSRHTLGCHGHEHFGVRMMGAARFRSDLLRSKAALEDMAGVVVTAFRAPYLSADRCDPWFGEVLAECGFSIDSSRRLRFTPPRFEGLTSLPE